LASVLARPSSVTSCPVTTFWARPALATGATLPVPAEITVVAGSLSRRPSLTMSVAT
jgi:hypothetical protein